ncbi:hypothetical protein BH23GEM6_BH23GEM6_04470 [soil metagenome]
MSTLRSMEWAAERLGEPLHAVYRMGRDGLLPVVRLGRRMKVDPAKLENWIDAGGQALPGGWRKEA